MNKLLLVGLITLTAGCVSQSKMLKNMGDQKIALENRCKNEIKFNLVVQESIIAEQCQGALDELELRWRDVFCMHDKRMADAIAKAYGMTPKYFAPCLKILKNIKTK